MGGWCPPRAGSPPCPILRSLVVGRNETGDALRGMEFGAGQAAAAVERAGKAKNAVDIGLSRIGARKGAQARSEPGDRADPGPADSVRTGQAVSSGFRRTGRVPMLRVDRRPPVATFVTITTYVCLSEGHCEQEPRWHTVDVLTNEQVLNDLGVM